MLNEETLRTVCQPDDPLPHAHHAHLCPACGTCWRHPDSLASDPACGSSEFHKAHDCPACGTNQRSKHWPNLEAIELAITNLLGGI